MKMENTYIDDKSNEQIILKASNLLKIAQDIIIDDTKIIIIMNPCESIIIRKQLLTDNANLTFA